MLIDPLHAAIGGKAEAVLNSPRPGAYEPSMGLRHGKIQKKLYHVWVSMRKSLQGFGNCYRIIIKIDSFPLYSLTSHLNDRIKRPAVKRLRGCKRPFKGMHKVAHGP